MKSGNSPFGPGVLPDLVRAELVNGSWHVATREGVTKEFKERFSWGSIGLYARTMAAFANARGGYLIFGVTDNPRVAVGLPKTSRTAFDNLDQAKLTQSLNELFSPELDWEIGLVEIGDVTLGAIYVYESTTKPLIARKQYQQQNANISEGDIFYRYNSRTERIKFPELRNILDVAMRREQQVMMSHVQELIQAGASNAAVLDFTNSTLRGASGQKLLIDERLLQKISFIREGEFNEVKGAPALKLVGDVQSVKTLAIGPERLVRSALNSEAVLLDFLEQKHISDGEPYIRQIAAGTTSFLPVQYYGVAAGLDSRRLIELIESVNTRSPSKERLLVRLRAADEMRANPPSASSQFPSSGPRRAYYEALVAGTPPTPPFATADAALNFLVALRSLDNARVNTLLEPLLALTKSCFEDFYSSDGRVADGVRRAACRIDKAIFSAPPT